MVGLDDFANIFMLNGGGGCAEGNHQSVAGPSVILGDTGYYHCFRCGQNYTRTLSLEEKMGFWENLNRLGPIDAEAC